MHFYTQATIIILSNSHLGQKQTMWLQSCPQDQNITKDTIKKKIDLGERWIQYQVWQRVYYYSIVQIHMFQFPKERTPVSLSRCFPLCDDTYSFYVRPSQLVYHLLCCCWNIRFKRMVSDVYMMMKIRDIIHDNIKWTEPWQIIEICNFFPHIWLCILIIIAGIKLSPWKRIISSSRGLYFQEWHVWEGVGSHNWHASSVLILIHLIACFSAFCVMRHSFTLATLDETNRLFQFAVI